MLQQKQRMISKARHDDDDSEDDGINNNLAQSISGKGAHIDGEINEKVRWLWPTTQIKTAF